MEFVHLQTHSYYSLDYGVDSPAALARAAAERGMPALALTDRGTLAGMGEFMEACRRHGVKALIGAELSILTRRPSDGAQADCPLIALIENEAGYRSLTRLLNAGHRAARAVGRAPAVPFADFVAGAEGLIVLTGGARSELFYAALDRRVEAALKHVQSLQRAVGPDRVFIAIQPPHHAEADKANRRLIDLAEYLKTPPVATQSVQYVDPSSHLAAFVLQHGDALREADWADWLATRPARHLASADEMKAHFAFYPALLENTLRVAQRCRFALARSSHHFPMHALPHGWDSETSLWERVVAGLREAEVDAGSPEVKERLDREMGQIRQARLGPHLLLLHALARDLDQAGVTRGPARGLWQRSLAAYALGLAALDPHEYHLPEPDWLNLECQLPVYPFEIAEQDLPAALKVVERRLGAGRICRAGRHPRWRRAALLRELGRRLELPRKKIDRLLQERSGETGTGVGYGEGPGYAGDLLESRLRVDDAAFLRRAVKLLSGRPLGSRADGQLFALSGIELEDAVPLDDMDAGGPVAGFDSEALDALGIPRLDLAGSPLIDTLALAARTIREQEDPEFRHDALPLEDSETFELLGAGLTNGFTDLHSITAKALLRASPPRSILDLAAIAQTAARPVDAGGAPREPDMAAWLPAALTCYWAAWTKRHYPLHFMAALLSRRLSQPKMFAILLRETRRMRIAVLPPDLNLSVFEFTPEKGAIRAGLSVVRQLGRRGYAELERERRSRPFDDLVDLCERVNLRVVNKRAIANLIKAGALDRFERPRSHMLASLDEITRDVKAEREPVEEPEQLMLFDMSGLERKTPGSALRLDEVPEFDEETLLRHEAEAVGCALSADPFEFYLPLMRQLNARGPFELRRRENGREAFVAAYIDHVEREGHLIEENVAAALDCEGAVARVARGARSYIGADMDCEGPALLGGVVRARGAEAYLEVMALYSLDEVYRLSRRVRTVTLDLRGENNTTVGWIVDLLKQYKGDTETRVAGIGRAEGRGIGDADESARVGGGEEWTEEEDRERIPDDAEKIEGRRTLFCPPVYLGLRQLLMPDRIRLEDAEGAPVELNPPVILK